MIKRLFNNKIASVEQVTCPYCTTQKPIDEYDEYKNEEMSNFEYLRKEENTFCPYSGCFTCTECYARIGAPLVNKLKKDAYLVFRLKVESLPHQDTQAISRYLYG